MNQPTPADFHRITGEALSHGIAGDRMRGVALLQPLVDAGPLSTFALLGGLAEVAAHTALQNQLPGETFGLPVNNVLTGEPASADVLPPPLRFAAQFVTTWANRDRDTARALFETFAFESDRTGSPDLAEAIGLVYDMAVTTGAEVVRQARQERRKA
ncbi:hypothetical protein [Streptomyces sp. CCM_MD2014]|uniref:hypothetical protein n=1 Tax=Streptomyces sp. CCM_MD2014 TaxID=1561022 RepID=UPI00052A484B|nr:hypothetical protein [Streptomyces sp. CCM_MD2014]AIV35566.1 hypothetical protein NI25_20380 [Streptomyces sp. CCM_MD2014]